MRQGGDGVIRSYIIAYSEYAFRGEAPRMTSFTGTFRQLLEHLNGVTDENRTDTFEKDGREITVDALTEDEMVKDFDVANGDGQPYIMVWSVAAKEKVLG